jgi:hypothetical protein
MSEVGGRRWGVIVKVFEIWYVTVGGRTANPDVTSGCVRVYRLNQRERSRSKTAFKSVR